MPVLRDFTAHLDRVAAYGRKILVLACRETFSAASAVPPIAIGLLARTLEHAQAIRVLLAAEHPVDARIIARCCLENCFVAAALAEHGDEFAERLLSISSASIRKSFTELSADIPDLHSAIDDAMHDLILDIVENAGKQSSLNLREAAESGGIGPMYRLYKTLSEDAAHPSLASLRRHTETVQGEDGNWRIIVSEAPEVSESERCDGLETAALAILGVTVSVATAMGIPGSPAELREIQESAARLRGQLQPDTSA